MNRETPPQPNPEPQNRDLSDVLKSQPTDPDLFTSVTPPEGLLERHTTKPRDPKISEILRDLPLPSQKKPENLPTALEEAMRDVYSSIEDAAAKESNEREAKRAALIEEQAEEMKNRKEAEKEKVSNRIKHEEDNRKTRQENTRKDSAKRSLEYFLGLGKSSDRLEGLTPFLYKLTMNLRKEAENNNIQDRDPKEIYAFVDRIKALEQMDADLTYQEKQRKESNKEAAPFIEGTFLGFRDDLRKVNIETLSAEDIEKTKQSLIATIPQKIELGTRKKTRDEFKGELDKSLKILQGSYTPPEIKKMRTVRQSPQTITPKEVPPSIIINPPTETLIQETAEMEQEVAAEEGWSEVEKEWFRQGEAPKTTEMEQEVAIETTETEKKRGMLSRLIEKIRGKNKKLEEEIQERVPTLFEKLRGRGSRMLVTGAMLVAVIPTLVKNIDYGGEPTDRGTISAPAKPGDGGGAGVDNENTLALRGGEEVDGTNRFVLSQVPNTGEGGPQGQPKNLEKNTAHTATAGEDQGEPEEVGPPEKGDEAAEQAEPSSETERLTKGEIEVSELSIDIKKDVVDGDNPTKLIRKIIEQNPEITNLSSTEQNRIIIEVRDNTLDTPGDGYKPTVWPGDVVLIHEGELQRKVKGKIEPLREVEESPESGTGLHAALKEIAEDNPTLYIDTFHPNLKKYSPHFKEAYSRLLIKLGHFDIQSPKITTLLGAAEKAAAAPKNPAIDQVTAGKILEYDANNGLKVDKGILDLAHGAYDESPDLVNEWEKAMPDHTVIKQAETKEGSEPATNQESQEPGTDVVQIVEDLDKLLTSLSRYNKAMLPLKSVIEDPVFQKLLETEEFRNKLKAGLHENENENDIDILLGTLRSITPESLMSETAKKDIQEAQEYLHKVSSYMTKCDLIISNEELGQDDARIFLEEISTLAEQGVVPYQKARAQNAIKKALKLFKDSEDWENYVATLE